MGDESSLFLCVDTMRFPCSALSVKVVKHSREARTGKRERQNDNGMTPFFLSQRLGRITASAQQSRVLKNTEDNLQRVKPSHRKQTALHNRAMHKTRNQAGHCEIHCFTFFCVNPSQPVSWCF